MYVESFNPLAEAVRPAGHFSLAKMNQLNIINVSNLTKTYEIIK